MFPYRKNHQMILQLSGGFGQAHDIRLYPTGQYKEMPG